MKHLLLTLISLLYISFSYAQSTYTAEQVKEDINTLITFIEKNHPDLDIHAPQFVQEARHVLAGISGEKTSFEVFQLASRVATLAKENHYDIGNWEDEVHAGILDNTFSYFPFYVRVLDDGIFVYRNLSQDTQVKPGDRIHTINGQDTDEILNTLFKHIPSDADIKTFRQRSLDLTFHWMYYLVIGQPETYELEMSRDNKKFLITVDAQSADEIVANYNANPNGPETPQQTGADRIYSFEVKDEYAVLKLRSFNYGLIQEHDLKSNKIYKDIFTELSDKNIDHLVIDLRGNTGGRNEFSDDLLPYINKLDKDGVYKTSISWEGKVKQHKLPNPDKSVFKGKIYVLTDGRTYSAGATVARNLREYGNAVLIGEEAGSRYEGFVAGSKNSLVLPNSGLRINVPRYAYRFPESEAQPELNRGALPDHAVKPNIEQILQQEDPVMAFALKLIEKSLSGE